MPKRLVLFLVTNLAVMVALSVVMFVLQFVLAMFGVTFGADTGRLVGLAAFAAIAGFGGALISLAISKWMAIRFTRARRLDPNTTDPRERFLLATVEELASRAGIGMPDVAIYEGEANAFATGARRNNALVAVSTDLLELMPDHELRAVLAHEVAHIKNGDMITMTLIQGVLSTFTILISRVIARALTDNGLARLGLVIVLQLIGSVANAVVICAYSRRREFAADRAAAELLGSTGPVVASLRRLVDYTPGTVLDEDGDRVDRRLPQELAAFGLNGAAATDALRALFATHPPMQERIDTLLGYRSLG